jgi:hypothetical protein
MRTRGPCSSKAFDRRTVRNADQFSAPESLYRLTDVEFVYDHFKEDLVVKLVAAQAGATDVNREELESLAQALEIPWPQFTESRRRDGARCPPGVRAASGHGRDKKGAGDSQSNYRIDAGRRNPYPEERQILRDRGSLCPPPLACKLPTAENPSLYIQRDA